MDGRRPSSSTTRHAAIRAGVFCVAAATLMYEILLTRIFSVTMWYHFAFLAVAAALLGMTAGAIIVQARPPRDDAPASLSHLATAASLFALGVPLTFLAHLSIPFVPTLTPTGLLSVLLTYAVIAIPFVFSGVCICLALTRPTGSVGSIYAADLLGAATGCVATVGILRVADAPASVLMAAAVAGAGAAVFALAGRQRRLLLAAVVVTAALLLGAAAKPSWLRVTWVKGAHETGPTLHERWNSYSRIRIAGDPAAWTAPFGWGLSSTYPADRRVRQLLLSIDGIADTVLTRFDGDLAAVEHLRYDVTNLAHYLRHNASVLVIGAGGGRDVLAALAFGQAHVVAVEVNEAILHAVNGRFGAFTGHLDRRPAVSFVNDEARSWVARDPRRFDIIQVSFIDTFAATAAGAYVLTEHSLYTTEAWRTFLDHLADDGILTLSRWYFHRSPAEIQRLVALATTSLLASGATRPRDHLILVRTRSGADPRYRDALGVGTLLVARRPFSASDIATTREVATALGFDVVLDPRNAADPTLAMLASPDTLARAVTASLLDISPPTDDRPFFFHTLRLGSIPHFATLEQANESFNLAAVLVLVGALVLVGILTAAYLTFPTRRAHGAGRWEDRLFFAAIGLGYIVIEMSQLQRLSVFLGHPTHALTVVLFALLLSSGAGSLVVGRLRESGTRARALGPVLAIPLVLAAFGLLTPPLISHLRALETPLRIVVAIGLLVPIGFVMGTAFPHGLQLVLRRTPEHGPWMWGINGAASVLGSLVAVLLSISAGVAAAFWTGVAAYLVAAVAVLRMAGAEARRA